MAAQVLPWIQATEAVVGLNHPTLADVENRPLRTLLTLVGQNPDAPFTGLVPTFNVRSFGAVGDGIVDDYPVFAAIIAAVPDAVGGTIHAPMTLGGKYYLSQSLHITKPINFSGALYGQPVPNGTVGTALEFAADQTGIYVEGRDTFGDTYTFPNTRSLAGWGGGEFSTIENLTIISRGGQFGTASGGTGVLCDGIRVRAAQVKIRRTWVDGFHRNGIRIWATSGSGDPTLNGNCNLWRLDSVTINRSGDDGFSVFGADANAGVATLCDFSVNGGRGSYDGSLLGNTYDACHWSGNVGRCIETDNINAKNGFYNCYVEGAGSLTAGQQARILGPAIVIGGIMAAPTDPGMFTTDTTALVITGSGIMPRTGFQHINKNGATTVAIRVGKNDANQNVLVIGTSDTNIPLEDVELNYGGTNPGWYDWRDNGTPARAFFSFPNRTLLATLRAYAPAFRNGLFFGVAGSATMVHHKVSSGPPTTGTWVKGDRVYNDYSVSGTSTGIEHWYCQVAGTPGTWVPGRASGTLTLAAANNTVIANTAVQAGSRIFLFPTNAAAATLMNGTKSLYVGTKTASTSFTVNTADATVAAGTETFDYLIVN